jgi:hypothetical protein
VPLWSFHLSSPSDRSSWTRTLHAPAEAVLTPAASCYLLGSARSDDDYGHGKEGQVGGQEHERREEQHCHLPVNVLEGPWLEVPNVRSADAGVATRDATTSINAKNVFMAMFHFKSEGERACRRLGERTDGGSIVPLKRSTLPVLINLPWALRWRHRH